MLGNAKVVYMASQPRPNAEMIKWTCKSLCNANVKTFCSAVSIIGTATHC